MSNGMIIAYPIVYFKSITLMKKLIQSACVLILSAFVFPVQAQEFAAPVMPVNELTKLITYTSVVTVPGVKKDELYKRALAWASEYYKNPTEVIRENDAATQKLVLKPRYRLYTPEDKKGMKADAGLGQYTLTIESRDGRYKSEITEVNWKRPSYYPIERWMDKNAPMYDANYEYYLYQTDLTMREVQMLLEKAMTAAPVIDKSNEW